MRYKTDDGCVIEDGTLISNGLVFGQSLSSELQGVKQICENKAIGKMAVLTDAEEVKMPTLLKYKPKQNHSLKLKQD